jgi:hypothetical protein
MNARTRVIFFSLVLALGGRAVHAQMPATYGDAPAAKATGAADAAGRALDRGTAKADTNDAQLLGGPAGYEDRSGTLTGQDGGAAPERKTKAPKPGDAANPKQAGLPPQGAANAALQLYGDGTPSGAAHRSIYRSPW